MRIVPLILAAAALIVAGCAPAAPHESLNRALHKTFETKGYNYRSATSLTRLTLPPEEVNVSAGSSSFYLEKGVEMLRSLSLSAEGAVDIARGRSEATYDFRYSQNNVEISVKFPLLLDDTGKALYLGKSFLHTVLPLRSGDSRLIRFDLNGTIVQEMLAGSTNAGSFGTLNRAFGDGVLRMFNDINATLVTGDSRRQHIRLDHNRSVGALLAFAEGAAERLRAEGVLSAEEYEAYRSLDQRGSLEELLAGVSISLAFEVSIDSDGRIGGVGTAVDLSDPTDGFCLGIENVTSFTRYNAPSFTIDPEQSGSVDFRELFQEDDPLLAPVKTIEKIFQQPADVNDALG